MPLLLHLTSSQNAALAEASSTVIPVVDQFGDPFAAFIEEGARRFAIPADWIRSILSIESAGDVHATSTKGAMGLMQIMPATWTELRRRYHLGNDPYDPRDNILAGTAYLRELFGRYGWPGALAAYNAGPSRYERHLAGGLLPDETRAYVAKFAGRLGVGLPPMSTAARQRSAASTPFAARSDLTRRQDQPSAFVSLSDARTAASRDDVSAMIPRGKGVFVARSGLGTPP
ncbi:hypothetical protein AS156_16155 [Bradyrhizobium macuxiense]|uniref:Transglycosylase SLT domain-containing protein n=1 Tax=Bradyrhizobium macuxiense TaxID=1755647 RepID=A0A109JIB8_9BRAD|nr:hypothetical protein AS156_16155 [Bradyrhizobium macuxiense]